MFAPQVTWHTSISYWSSCHTCVNMGAAIFFTAAMIRAFKSARSRGNGGTNTQSLTYVASSLNCTYSRKWSSEIIKSCNCKQKSSRRLWSSSDNCCTIWMRYGLNTKRLCRTLHTVVFDIDSPLAAVPVDFFGLCRKLARTHSTSSSAVNGQPLDFRLHRHPVSVNCLYHAQMVLSVGGSFTYFAWNAQCTVTTDLLMRYSNIQNDFSPGAAIFSLHTLASPSTRNVNYDEKQLIGEKSFELFLLSAQVS